MSNLGVGIFMVMLVSTCSKPLESTNDQLNEMEKDLASLSNISVDDREHVEDEDKIPQSLLQDLLTQSDKSGQGSKPFDLSALQGFAPGTAPKRSMEDKGVLLSNDDINDTQKRLFEILSREKSEDDPKNAEPNSPDEEENKDKIPEDLLKDLEPENREDQPRKPESTWLEPADENDPTKKEILTSILMDEIVNEIKERNKRGERIPQKVIDLLRKYNTKRSGPKL